MFFLDMSNDLSVRFDVIALPESKEPQTGGGSFFMMAQLTGDSFDTQWHAAITRPQRALISEKYSHKFRQWRVVHPFAGHRPPSRSRDRAIGGVR